MCTVGKCVTCGCILVVCTFSWNWNCVKLGDDRKWIQRQLCELYSACVKKYCESQSTFVFRVIDSLSAMGLSETHVC